MRVLNYINNFFKFKWILFKNWAARTIFLNFSYFLPTPTSLRDCFTLTFSSMMLYSWSPFFFFTVAMNSLFFIPLVEFYNFFYVWVHLTALNDPLTLLFFENALNPTNFFEACLQAFCRHSYIDLTDFIHQPYHDEWLCGKTKGLEDPFFNKYQDFYTPFLAAYEVVEPVQRPHITRLLSFLPEHLIEEEILTPLFERINLETSNACKNEAFRRGYRFGAALARDTQGLIVDCSELALRRTFIAPFPDKNIGIEIINRTFGE
jgi:hypothetical protein